MNKVIGGRFDDCPIKLDGARRCLYIQAEGTRYYLVKDNIANYEVRESKNTLITGATATCVLEWSGGKKSVIIIDKSYYTFLVNGCELYKSEIDPTGNKGRRSTIARIVSTLVGLVIIAATVLLLVWSHSDRSNGTFSYWDGSEPKPDADVLITIDLAEGDVENNLGYITGDFYNNSGRAFTHLEAIYTLYDTDGNKFGRCTFSAFDLDFSPRSTQGYTAPCEAWRQHGIYQLDSVGFY